MDGCVLLALWLVVLGGLGAGVWVEIRRSRRERAFRTRLDELELQLSLLARRGVEPPTAPSESSQPEPARAPVETDEAEPHEPAPGEAERVPEPAPAAAPPSPRPRGPAQEQAPPPAAARRPRVEIEWEQWIGVRGAAVLGAVVLAFAGILFVRYGIETGLISPATRVALGLVAGVAAIAGAEPLRRRGYGITADGLSGAGVVLLYAATWAARVLYELIGFGVAFGMMALVTVAGGVLSWRHRSRLIALLGLIGGFATPLLVSSDTDSPVGLFGYLLLLNLGVSALARRGGWPILTSLALLATVLYQGLWIVGAMGSERVLGGVLVLALFAALFVATGAWQSARAESAGVPRPLVVLVNQIGGVATPFVFALYLAGNSELGAHLWPLGALLVLLNAGAAWLAGVHRLPALGAGVAAASLAVVVVFSARTRFDTSLAWEAAATLLLVALAHHLWLEQRAGARAPALSEGIGSWVAAGGGLFVLAALQVARTVSQESHLWIWLGAAVLAAALLLRQSVLVGSGAQEITAGLGLGVGAAVALATAALGTGSQPAALRVLVAVLALAAALQLWPVLRDRAHQRSAEAAAALVPALVLASWLSGYASERFSVVGFHLASVALAWLVVLCATRLRSGLWFALAVVLLAVVHLIPVERWQRSPDAAPVALGLQLGTVALLLFWPLLSRLRSRAARRAAAVAPALWFLSLYALWDAVLGDSAIGALPILLGASSLLAALWSRRVWADDERERRSALAWFGAVALGFVSVAIPLQLEREWITVGWALEGLAVLALWRRLDHAGLKVVALALFAAVTTRLVANPALLEYHASGSEPFGLPVVNWISYTYLVPAVAMMLGARILAGAAPLRSAAAEAEWTPQAGPKRSVPLEVARQRPLEAPIYRHGKPLMAYGVSMAVVAIVFVWINLTIFDAFAPGAKLAISFDRLPARDLTLSVSWAVYALILLALGIARASVGLRWISLGFLLLAIGKVFLYDLGELSDLYRVGSLAGLAVSLIAVSLLYQRFVFGGRNSERPEPR